MDFLPFRTPRNLDFSSEKVEQKREEEKQTVSACDNHDFIRMQTKKTSDQVLFNSICFISPVLLRKHQISSGRGREQALSESVHIWFKHVVPTICQGLFQFADSADRSWIFAVKPKLITL